MRVPHNMITKLFFVAGFAGIAAVASLSLNNAGTLNVGDKIPDFKFNEVVWSYDGTSSLTEHLGEPILVDFWGKNCGPCIGSAVPHAIKMLEKYGDQGLHVLLVESQNHSREEIVPFMAQYWTGRVPMGVLGTNAPFQLPGNTLPKAALIGVDGTIVWTGSGGEGCEKVLEEQLAKLHQLKPLEGPLKGLTKDLNARNFGKVMTAARNAVAKPANDKVKESAETLVNHLTKTVESRMAIAKRLAEAGRPQKALNLMKTVSKQVAGDKEWSDSCAAMVKELEAASKDDLAADKIVTEAEDLGRDKAGRAAAAAKLADVSKKFGSAKVVKYAEELKLAYETKNVAK